MKCYPFLSRCKNVSKDNQKRNNVAAWHIKSKDLKKIPIGLQSTMAAVASRHVT